MIRQIAIWFRTLLMANALASAGLAAAQNADIPNEFREGRALANGFSGDRRIKLATFHTLLVVDTNHPSHLDSGQNTLSEIGSLFNAVNDDLIESAKKANQLVPSEFGVVVRPDSARQLVLQGDQVNQAEIYAAIDEIGKDIRRLSNNGQDVFSKHVVFAWFETEGGIDKTGKRFLDLHKGEKLDREDLRKRLEFWENGDRLTRLVVFATDACSTKVAGDPNSISAGLAPSPPGIWRSLYFGHRNTVDISSSQPGKPAFAINGVSLFARAFRAGFDRLNKGQIDSVRNGRKDGFIEWHAEFLHAIENQLNKAPDDKKMHQQSLDDTGSTVERLVTE